jgi:hypothetical protein
LTLYALENHVKLLARKRRVIKMALNETSKPWYLSKTLWLQILGIVAVIVPASAGFIAQYFS